MYVRNHEVSGSVLRPPRSRQAKAFSPCRLPEKKKPWRSRTRRSFRGYPAARIHWQRGRGGQETLQEGLHDHAMSVRFDRFSHAWSQNQWPKALPSLRPAMWDYFRPRWKSSHCRLLQGFCPGRSGPPAGFLRPDFQSRSDERPEAQPLPAAGDHGTKRRSSEVGGQLADGRPAFHDPPGQDSLWRPGGSQQERAIGSAVPAHRWDVS